MLRAAKLFFNQDVAVSGASGAFEVADFFGAEIAQFLMVACRQALLWHMVFEEEIGSVKGHIGPLLLGEDRVACVLLVMRKWIRSPMSLTKEHLGMVSRRCWFRDRWGGRLRQSSSSRQGLLHREEI